MQDSKRYYKPDVRLGKEGTTYEIYQRCLIIRLNDELDHHNAVKIREQSDKLIDRNHIKHIIFDFSGTDFMDSAGIGLILGRKSRVSGVGGTLTIRKPKPAIRKLLKLSKMESMVE